MKWNKRFKRDTETVPFLCPNIDSTMGNKRVLGLVHIDRSLNKKLVLGLALKLDKTLF